MKDEKEIKTTERIYRDYCQFNKIKEPNKKWIPVEKVLSAIEEESIEIDGVGKMISTERLLERLQLSPSPADNDCVICRCEKCGKYQ